MNIVDHIFTAALLGGLVVLLVLCWVDFNAAAFPVFLP